MNNGNKKQHQRRGFVVFMALGFLTAAEFAIATLDMQWWSVFIIIAIIKAWLVIQYYMHFPRLFAEERVSHDN